MRKIVRVRVTIANQAAKKTKMGWKGKWTNTALDDFIDIVANNESYRE